MNWFVICDTLSPNGLLFSAPSVEQTRPGLHGTHRDSSVVPRNGDHVPIGQFLHVMLSRNERAVPLRQTVGLYVPSTAHSYPAGQAKQVWNPLRWVKQSVSIS